LAGRREAPGLTRVILWERYYPYILALAVTVGWVVIGIPFPKDRGALLGAAVTVAAVLGGFLGASKAIILSITKTESFIALKSAGYTEDLFSYLSAGIIHSLLFAIVSLAGFFIISSRPVWSFVTQGDVFSVFWVFSAVLAVLSYFRISNIMLRLLRRA